MTFFETCIITILGSLIIGLLTLTGVFLTLRHNTKIIQMKQKEEENKQRQDTINNRPEFKIVSRKCDFSPHGYQKDDSIDIDFMVTLYNGEYTKEDFKSNLVSVEYVLKNVGENKVEHIDICYYDNNHELLDMTRNDLDRFIDNPRAYPTSSYVRFDGLKIHNNEAIKIRIWYRSDNIISRRMISYPCFIGIKAFNKLYWRQNFDAPYDGIEDSEVISSKEYFNILFRKDQWGK